MEALEVEVEALKQANTTTKAEVKALKQANTATKAEVEALKQANTTAKKSYALAAAGASKKAPL